MKKIERDTERERENEREREGKREGGRDCMEEMSVVGVVTKIVFGTSSGPHKCGEKRP